MWDACLMFICLTLSGAGVWRLSEQRGGGGLFHPPSVNQRQHYDCPKNGFQPHISPRLRCFNRKITKKLFATCVTRHLFWFVIFTSSCSLQGIVGKKRDHRILDPLIFSGKIRKNTKSQEKYFLGKVFRKVRKNTLKNQEKQFRKKFESQEKY